MKKQLLKFGFASVCALLYVGAMAQLPYAIGTSIKAAGTITVDGVADEADWASATQYDVDKVFNLDTTITSDEDCSGWFKTTWTADGIYVLIWSTDDAHFPSGGLGAGYEQDINEIYFKYVDELYGDATACATGLSQSCANANNGTYQFSGPRDEATITTGTAPCLSASALIAFKVAIDGAATNVTEEFFVPWDSIAGVIGGSDAAFDPTSGDTLGFDITITDNDNDPNSGNRDRLVWSNDNTVPGLDEDWGNMTNVGRLIFAEEGVAVNRISADSKSLIKQTLVVNTITLDASVQSIAIYNVAGQKVLDAVNVNGSVDVSTLSQGLYIVAATTAKETVAAKIVKQ